MRAHRNLCLLPLLGALLISASPSLAETGPRETIEHANQEIQRLVSKGAPTQTDEIRERRLREIVTTLLDLDDMARRALGRDWSRRSESEKQEYLSLMRQLVERSYLKQARSRVNYDVSFGQVSVDGSTAEVETELRFTTRGRQEMIEVVYTMTRREGVWRVTDIETDGASMVLGYRTQFRQIISAHGFGELISRMRQRLEAGEVEL